MDLRALEPWNDESRPVHGPDGRVWRVTEHEARVSHHGALETRNRLVFRDARWQERTVLCDRPLWSLSDAELEELLRRTHPRDAGAAPEVVPEA